MMSSTTLPVLDLLAQRGPVPHELPEEAAAHLEGASGQDVVERRHALEQRDVLERARDPAACRLVGRMRGRVAPLNVIRPCWGGRSR